jgi:hypothetical protein
MELFLILLLLLDELLDVVYYLCFSYDDDEGDNDEDEDDNNVDDDDYDYDYGCPIAFKRQ